MRRHLVAIGLVALAVAGCAAPETTPDLPNTAVDHVGGPGNVPAVTSESALVKSLGLSRPADQLGAIEKTFNSCQLTPNVEPCATRYITLVHFQLLCRDSEGTVSETPVDLQPIATDDLKWNVQTLAGQSRTDDRGFGEIVALSDRSLLDAHVTLRMGSHFLGLTLGEITRVVLPSNFCAKR